MQTASTFGCAAACTRSASRPRACGPGRLKRERRSSRPSTASCLRPARRHRAGHRDRGARAADPAAPFVADAETLQSRLQPGVVVAIIGGGYIGLEMAEALHRRGHAVTLIEAAASLLPGFRPEVGVAVRDALARRGARSTSAPPWPRPANKD